MHCLYFLDQRSSCSRDAALPPGPGAWPTRPHRHTRLGSWLGYTLQKDLFQFVIRVLVFSVLCTLLPALVYFREIGVSCDKERSSTSYLLLYRPVRP